MFIGKQIQYHPFKIIIQRTLEKSKLLLESVGYLIKLSKTSSKVTQYAEPIYAKTWGYGVAVVKCYQHMTDKDVSLVGCLLHLPNRNFFFLQ